MERSLQPPAPTFSARDAWLSRAILAAVSVLVFPALIHEGAHADQRVDRRQQARLDEALRRESDALVEIAQAAMEGRRVPSDFSMEWRNDYLKAQPGTFVPFTVALDTTLRSELGALMYVRVVERPINPERQRRRELPFPYETMFPIDQALALPVRIRRGFAVPPGRYTVVVVLRDRPANPLDRKTGPLRTGLLIRELEVPDFWTDSLSTSTVMLADRVEPLTETVPAGRLDENPYVVGTNRIHPASGDLVQAGRGADCGISDL